MIPEKLEAGFRRFRDELYPRHKRTYERLADKGQTPHTLVIGCSDSRVDPAAIFDAGPGELFVVRNVANLVPPFETDGGFHGVSAAVEFAVGSLKVSNILVMGHRQCGGVEACASGHSPEDSLFVGHWISALHPALEESRADVGADAPLGELSADLELRAIRHSIERLKTYPFVEKALAEGRLALHGARFGVADGELEWLGDDGTFSPVRI
ncbi:carbonic anhydrase [Hyphobacterium marinum]|uniref:Carbonic anhydrase n=1 Tax=Hyphobacterium marinum TaxID=3116574 RepID=A0ABU7M0A6_9PROT|nr:carbonic anhydrase [Hyphobacterium sp. Y6023]MEE2567136.1 carbonic anhydrase [Hyphobacterium sp. Y6023]